MAVQQINSAFQNDGNFCQLDLQDMALMGPILRIETFRASQPEGQYGITKAGTHVETIAGIDHLTAASNSIFRHVYSVTRNEGQVVILEIREAFDPSGAFEVRVRDVDGTSPSFGDVIKFSCRPVPGNKYDIEYEVRVPQSKKPRIVLSPVKEKIASIGGLADIGESPDSLGQVDASLPNNPLTARIQWNGPKSEINVVFSEFEKIVQNGEKYAQLKSNILNYLRMGDFRDKCIHDGTNLVGYHSQLASEFIPIRAYRMSLMALGRIADRDMYKHTLGGMSPMIASDPLATDPKPGVYTPFLTAYISNVEVYQLGLDKVHSDYGGVPMKLGAGSRLENGAEPIVDSSRVNRAIAELAFAFYVNPNPVAMRALSHFA
jgi:hypothetical protein